MTHDSTSNDAMETQPRIVMTKVLDAFCLEWKLSS
jgi:hypothetical protein